VKKKNKSGQARPLAPTWLKSEIRVAETLSGWRGESGSTFSIGMNPDLRRGRLGVGTVITNERFEL
jgi:hypothetical protein